MTEAPDPAAGLAAAYALDGPALELGVVVVDGEPHPDAQVRVPLSMPNRHGLVAGAVGRALGSSVFRSFARAAATAAGRETARSLSGTAPRRRSSSRRRASTRRARW